MLQSAARVVELVIAGGVSAALGALGILATIRVRVIRLEDRMQRDEEDLRRHIQDSTEALGRIERRQDAEMKLLANIARGMNLDKRAVDDILTRFWLDEENHT